MVLSEKTIEKEVVFEGRIITVRKDKAELGDGSIAPRELVIHSGGVCVVPLTDDNKVIMVRQFRYAFGEPLLEIPAGKLEKGEDPFEAGKREFKEETGGVAEEYISLGEIYPSPGYTNEIIRLYAAKNITFEEQNLDDDEFLQVCQISFDELIRRIMSGEIKDAKTIAAAFKLKELMNK